MPPPFRIFLLTVVATSVFAQGPLTPPGAPAPTMKTLDQIEARTPISPTGSFPIVINQPGSYYLTGNLTVASSDAIAIAADNVSLDLNGFTISSTGPAAAGAAISIGGALARSNIAICNGHISSGVTFSGGTYAGGGFVYGIYASGDLRNARVSKVSVRGVLFYAISLGFDSSVVESCNVSVAGSIGILARSASDCTALDCGVVGITVGTALNCYGVCTGSGAGLNATTATNCVGISNLGVGIAAGNVQNSTGSSTSGRGIVANSATNSNGTSDSGTGLEAILATGSQGRSNSGIGLYAARTASDCNGESTSGAYGLQAAGTANSCSGIRPGGTALKAAIAIGCTTFGGIVDPATNKFLGTP